MKGRGPKGSILFTPTVALPPAFAPQGGASRRQASEREGTIWTDFTAAQEQRTEYFVLSLGLESENRVRCKRVLSGIKFISPMEITFREDINPDADFYYRQQFKIYHKPYLIWDKETWEAVVTAYNVYRIEIDGRYGGDVLLEDRGKGIKYIVDFSILPEHQGKGIGKTVLEQIKAMSEKLTAVTRKETLHFFLKSGFVLKRTVKNYYRAGLAGYYMTFVRRPDRGSLADGEG